MTPQRRAVAAVLRGENVHLSAEVVLGRARQELPELSMATVYNTLNELVAMGEILEIANGGGPKRYDPNVLVAHHHLACTSCGSLQDVAIQAANPKLNADDLHGYLITGTEIVFQGLCPLCR